MDHGTAILPIEQCFYTPYYVNIKLAKQINEYEHKHIT